MNPTNSAVMSVRFKKAMRCRNYTRTGRIGGTLTIGANFNQQFTKSDYNSVLNDMTQEHHTDQRQANLYSYAQWGKAWSELYCRVGIGLNQRWMHVGEQKQSTFTIRPMLFVRYTVSPKIELRYQGSVSNIMPTTFGLFLLFTGNRFYTDTAR